MSPDPCKFYAEHTEPLWCDRRIVDRVTYVVCMVQDVPPCGECPFPARYCGVKAFEEEVRLAIAEIAGEVADGTD